MMNRKPVSLAATLLLTTCVLPGEPSDGERVIFELDFEEPYRVPLAGAVQPSIRIAADGRMLQAPSFRLESLDPSLARVDPTGRELQGIARGAATVRVIYATATGAPDTTFAVQVVVSRVAVVSPQVALTRLGDTVRLAASAFDANDALVSNVSFTWASADPAVATVSPVGLVTARNDGEAMVAAEADGVSDSAAVTVVQAAAQVRIAPELDTLRTVGRSAQFLAVAFDDTGAVLRTAKPRWSSSNESVARVDSSGLATASGAGTAQIIARVGTAADTATLAVAQVARFLVVTPRFDTLTAIADTARVAALVFDSLNFPIPNPSVVWATSDAAVATVDEAGLVQAAQNGVVLVTASSGGQSAYATVVVRQEVESAQISPDDVALTGAGATVQLSAVGLDGNGYPVTEAAFAWRSGSECIATVDAGLVTARGGGETTVIAAPVNGGGSDTAVVRVTGASAPGEIAFEQDPTGVLTVCAGREQILLANTSDYTLHTPAWSPDGTQIAFFRRNRTSSTCTGGIYIARADGSDARAVTDGCDHSPAWSPDGTRIAFTRTVYLVPDEYLSESAAIHIANADGTNTRRLGGGDIDNWWHGPTWSPDGTRLAFAHQTGRSSSSRIAFVNADGTGFTSTGAGHAPAWSPDGSQIAFGCGSICLMNSDGAAVTALVVDGEWESGEGVRKDWWTFEPSWSPDGAQIVFVFYAQCWNYGGTWYLQGIAVVGRNGPSAVIPDCFGGIPGFPPPRPASPTWRRIPALTPAAVPAAVQTRPRSSP